VKAFLSLAAYCLLLASPAAAGSGKNYIWRVVPGMDDDTTIVHGAPKDELDNDFMLVCHGGANQVALTLRLLSSGEHGGGSDSNAPTTFVFGGKRIPIYADSLDASEVPGGVAIEYTMKRNDPVLAALARGEAFVIVTPKSTTRPFSPKGAAKYFEEMARRCKI
jgi:hypothetical protein